MFSSNSGAFVLNAFNSSIINSYTSYYIAYYSTSHLNDFMISYVDIAVLLVRRL